LAVDRRVAEGIAIFATLAHVVDTQNQSLRLAQPDFVLPTERIPPGQELCKEGARRIVFAGVAIGEAVLPARGQACRPGAIERLFGELRGAAGEFGRALASHPARIEGMPPPALVRARRKMAVAQTMILVLEGESVFVLARKTAVVARTGLDAVAALRAAMRETDVGLCVAVAAVAKTGGGCREFSREDLDHAAD